MKSTIKNLVICGAGGLGREILSLIRRDYDDVWNVIGFIDPNLKLQSLVNGVPVLPESFLDREEMAVVLGMASSERKTMLLEQIHTKHNLMQELIKIYKVAEKALGYPVQESLIVLDATSGQNALTQAKMFKDAVNINGVVLTKLDGTAKGGVAVRVVSELKLPVRYIGFGEGIDDLRPFNAESFVEAMFDNDK